jgi:hypothetical protein
MLARGLSAASRLLRSLTPLGVALGLLATPTAVRAQSTAEVTGTVTSAGQPVQGVQVLVSGTRFGAITNAGGRFTILAVPVGSYTLRAQRIGFTPREQPITVVSGQVTSANFQLLVAPTTLTEQVIVGYTTQTRATSPTRSRTSRATRCATRRWRRWRNRCAAASPA